MPFNYQCHNPLCRKWSKSDLISDTHKVCKECEQSRVMLAKQMPWIIGMVTDHIEQEAKKNDEMKDEDYYGEEREELQPDDTNYYDGEREIWENKKKKLAMDRVKAIRRKWINRWNNQDRLFWIKKKKRANVKKEIKAKFGDLVDRSTCQIF